MNVGECLEEHLCIYAVVLNVGNVVSLAPVDVQLLDLLVGEEGVVEGVVGHLPYKGELVLTELLAPLALYLAHLFEDVAACVSPFELAALSKILLRDWHLVKRNLNTASDACIIKLAG